MLVRVISWIVVAVNFCSTNPKFANLCHLSLDVLSPDCKEMLLRPYEHFAF